MKYSLILQNISEIFTAIGLSPVLKGHDLLIAADENGKIAFAGESADFRKTEPDFETKFKDAVVDAGNKAVFPGLVDSHTHLVFAATREDEFAMKSRGATYEEIAAAGGGIINSTVKTKKATLEEIVEQASKRLSQLVSGINNDIFEFCLEIGLGFSEIRTFAGKCDLAVFISRDQKIVAF